MKKINSSSLFSIVVSLVLALSALSGVFSCSSQSAEKAPDAAVAKDDMAPRDERANIRGSTMTESDKKEAAGLFDGNDEVALEKAKSVRGNGDEGGPEASVEAAQRLTLREDLRVRSPEMLARIDKPDSEPLPFAAHDISVVIAGHRARVVYDMVFENPSGRTLSGTLMIELPQGASPCYLGMFQGTGLAAGTKDPIPALLPPKPAGMEKLLGREPIIEKAWQAPGGMTDWGELRAARVVNPVQGREVYEKVTRRRVDPALAEWAGGNKFSTRVFPIAPRSFKRVVFAYDRPLDFKSGSLAYALPLPAEIKARTRLFVHLVSGGVQNGRLVQTGRELPAKAAPYGSLWQTDVDKSFKGTMVFTGTLKNKNASALVGSDPEVKGKLVHVLLAPEMEAKAVPRDTGRAVFLVDTSLSAKDKHFARSGTLLKTLLESDSSLKEFAVLAFDVRPRPFTSGFVANTPANRAALFSALEGLWLEGATNFSGALHYLAADKALSSGDVYFLLSDGLITWGNGNPVELTNGFPDLLAKRWICYGFGDEAANRALFTALTRSSGQYVSVGPEQDLKKAASAHRFVSAALDALYGANQEEVLAAGAPHLLYPGQVLSIACRTRGIQASLALVVSVNGRKQTFAVDLSEQALTASLAARSWAEVYVDRLLDLYDAKANETVLALSQRFGLSNREASFIILETDEEYAQHKIDPIGLEFKEINRQARERKTRFPFGSPETDDLSAETLELLDSLKKLENVTLWDAPAAPRLDGTRAVLAGLPGLKRPKETPVALYTWAQELHKASGRADPVKLEQALRALSSIVELKPQDDAGLRLVGYVLLEWSLYEEAEDLFRLVRQRRPFEPQNYLLEGLALAVQGKAAEAALRYEIVLNRGFPRFDEYVKPVASALYVPLLREVVKVSSNKRAAGLAAERLKGLEQAAAPRGRIFLFWNLDDTDVDLHVKEPGGEEVYYEHPDSRTGGRLFWDNTTGLGPEWYDHPTLHQSGFDVFVNYFGSSSVEGAAPSATLVCAFTRRGQGRLTELRFFTTALVGDQEGTVLIMPKWRP